MFRPEPSGWFVRRVRYGDATPRGFGFAWAEWQRRSFVVMPVPFNVLAARLRAAWLWVLRGGIDLPDNAAEAFEAGVRHGLGQRAGWIQGPED